MDLFSVAGILAGERQKSKSEKKNPKAIRENNREPENCETQCTCNPEC